MKKKFETNVATELPKTRAGAEPGLPWKVTKEDIENAFPGDDAPKDAASSTLKARPIFLILLLAAIFVVSLYFTLSIVAENENVRTNIQKKEEAVSSLQTDIEMMSQEKTALATDLEQLEKKVGDLNTQKELYTSVIESLTKKSEEAAGTDKL